MLSGPKWLWPLWLVGCAVCVANSATVYLCCPRGQGVEPDRRCVGEGRDWLPVLYWAENQTLVEPGRQPEELRFATRFPECNDTIYLAERQDMVVEVGKGSLFVNEEVIEARNYCITPKGMFVCVGDDHPFRKKKMEKWVRKCCLTDAMYSETQARCVAVNDTNNMKFMSEDTFILSGFPQCDSRLYAVAGKLDEEYSLNANGTLRSKSRQSVANYCVEHLYEQPDAKASVFMCAPPAGRSDRQDLRFTIYPLGQFLSIFFLSVTLVSSCMLPSSYHALHWKCQTHYVACLLVGQFLLAVAQLGGDTIRHSGICVGIATAMHFFFLSAFFWLNTMCFNIWWTFRDLRPTSLDKGQETYRLVLYELYAWGGPLIIVSVGAIMDQVLIDTYPAVLRPKFGGTRCWFGGNMELFVYFFGPIGLLLMVNLVLFVATTRELTCGLWKREVVKSTTERTALSHICLKLVIVMGITWIVDLLSWAIGGPKYVWYLTDLVNCLQGVFIFIVVGCQPQVWSAVKRMWCLSDSPSRNGGRSYSSNAMPSIINDHSSTKPAETLC